MSTETTLTAMQNKNQQITPAVAKKEVKPIDTVRAALERMRGQFSMALPKHITPERMVRVALTAIQNTPKLLDCDRQSLYSAIMRASQLGLEPDGVLGQAYLIPYGKTVQFIVGYKGLIDLARRSGDVSSIYAGVVHKNDNFEYEFGLEPKCKHIPADGDRGEVDKFYAVVIFKDGGSQFEVMTKKEVEQVRDKSSGGKNAVWKEYFVEMGKKTVIRRIAKYLPMSVQKATMVEDLVDAGKKFSADEYGDIIMEGEAVEATSSAQVASKLDAFTGETVDAETGEILSPVQPVAIPAKALASDATKTDWDAWVEQFITFVPAMADEAALIKLRKLNESILGNLEKINPPKFNYVMDAYNARMAEFDAMKGEVA